MACCQSQKMHRYYSIWTIRYARYTAERVTAFDRVLGAIVCGCFGVYRTTYRLPFPVRAVYVIILQGWGQACIHRPLQCPPTSTNSVIDNDDQHPAPTLPTTSDGRNLAGCR